MQGSFRDWAAYTDPILVFFGTKIAKLRKHPFPNLFPQIFRIRTVIFPQSGLKAKSMPEKIKIGSVYIIFSKKIELSKTKDIRRVYIYENQDEAEYLFHSKGIRILMDAANDKSNRFGIRFIEKTAIKENHYLHNVLKRIQVYDFNLIDEKYAVYNFLNEYRTGRKIKISIDPPEVRTCKNIFELCWANAETAEELKEKVNFGKISGGKKIPLLKQL